MEAKMKFMIRIFNTILIAITLITLLGFTGLANQSSLDIANKDDQKKMSSVLQEMLQDEWDGYRNDNPGLPGGIALKILSQKGDFFRSYGMGSEMTESTHFRPASITKTFTAASILLLQQRGLLDIEDTIISNIPGSSEPFLPDTPDYAIPYKDKITIRQLLEHRAGVFDISNSDIPAESEAVYAGQNYITYMLEQDSGHSFTIDELVGVVAAQKLFYTPPETEYHYSDTGYSLLGKIIERVSGQSYTYFVTRNFLEPCHLNNTASPYLVDDQILPSPFVSGYDYFDGEVYAAEDNITCQLANGNIISTPADIALWGKKLYTGQAGLEDKYVEMMMETKYVSDTTGYGLGCQYSDKLGYGHTGATRGYLSLMAYDPDNDSCIVIFSNVLNWNDPGNQLVVFKKIALHAKAILGY